MRSAAPVTQNHLSKKPEDMMLQNATPREICVCDAKCIFVDTLQRSHACHRFWKCCQTHMFCSLFARCSIQCACHTKRRLNVQKCFVPQGRALFQHLNCEKWSKHGVFFTFWLSNLLRATAGHFFNDLTSKSAPNAVCFVQFGFKMIQNVLRATTVWTF